VLLICLCHPVFSQDYDEETVLVREAEPAVEQEDTQEERRGFFGLGWLDSTQSFSSTQANALASQLDRYFGVERSDLEAAYSSFRFMPELRWQEGEQFDMRFRLRGRLHLPRIDERISLVFSEDQGEGTSYYTQNPVFDQAQSTKVNMEVNLLDRVKDRVDFRVGLRSNLAIRTSMRYRYESPLSDTLDNRISQTIYFIEDTGLGSFTQYQLDKSLTENSLLRWSNEYRHEEKLKGDEWSTSLFHLSRLGSNGAIGYFVRVAGNTSHNYVELYQVGVRLRRNFARPWLFWEFSPGYQWEQTSNLANRDGSWIASFRLEMAIGRMTRMTNFAGFSD
jgi:hypothetical protein